MIKKIILIFSFFLVTFNGISRDLKDFDRFYSIISKLESNNNPKAIGDNGLAIGIAQIHKNYFIDAQKYDKNLINNSYLDCFRVDISKKIVYAYLLKYSKTNDFEEWCRLHNSGPDWKNKRELTNKYYQKFLKIQLTLSK